MVIFFNNSGVSEKIICFYLCTSGQRKQCLHDQNTKLTLLQNKTILIVANYLQISKFFKIVFAINKKVI